MRVNGKVYKAIERPTLLYLGNSSTHQETGSRAGLVEIFFETDKDG